MKAEEILFHKLYTSQTENDVTELIENWSDNSQFSWKPYGGTENNFGVIENQQGNPIAALVEKLTNAIDAILMKKCFEAKIDPKSSSAPRTMEAAVEKFFSSTYKNWDLPKFRGEQALDIQIIADGPRLKTSLIIYDNGEGQHPENFENTFLSLLRGNKNEIHFVQGKYNMGGAGAIVFCGKNKYQLVASKYYDCSGKFGFTLVRKHPLNADEEKSKKNTWYEYLTIDNEIPAFDIDELDLGLYKRRFKTGSLIKLYSYDLPRQSRAVISRDLNQSINEFLFEPALPIYTIEKKERYPDDRNPERHLYGLKRRLEEDGNKYIEDYFSDEYGNAEIGNLKITTYIFKARVDGKSSKETCETIRREFFKNKMAVLFSVNGQVHGHLTNAFISRKLKYQLLKDYLIISVDCTRISLDYRNNLFMASRDRLRKGKEYEEIRDCIAKILKKGKLSQIYKHRKDAIQGEGTDTEELLKDISKDLPIDSELASLLGKTFSLDNKDEKKSGDEKSERKKGKKKEVEFNLNRYPSSFSINSKPDEIVDGLPMYKIPRGGTRKILFLSDVENQYFDRVEDPGELIISLLKPDTNDSEGGDQHGVPKKIGDLIYVQKSSPDNGVIKVHIGTSKETRVGDVIKIKASLTTNADNESFDEKFMVKISEKSKEKKSISKEKTSAKLSLPKCLEVYKNPTDGKLGWDKLDESGINIDYDTVMYPFMDAKGTLDKIYINMDSKALKNSLSSLQTQEQIDLVSRSYLVKVYFHTIFLYMITKNRGYEIRKKKDDGSEDVELSDFLKDIFTHNYSSFLISLETSKIVESLSD